MITPSDAEAVPALSASVQILPLPTGLYLFSVKSASDTGGQGDGQLRVPAMHVGLGPGVRSDQVEFIAGPATTGAWLFAKEDLLVIKVGNAGATLVLTSVRGPGGQLLTIKVERLDNRAAEPVAEPAAVAALPVAEAAGTTHEAPANTLPLQVTAHVRTRGDMIFTNAPWAGRVAPGLWIESFSIRPLDGFTVKDVEYKALTGSGFETPWLSDETMCGTKGMAVPLVGFAVRLRRNGTHAVSHDCEYSGYFKSGLTVGPLRNGAPCRSTVANDPLEGIQLRISSRANGIVPAKDATPLAPEEPQRAAARGPSFGRYRDEHVTTQGNAARSSNPARRPPARPE
jgi:hypothetical protein